MLENMLGILGIDKEKSIRETIIKTLDILAGELDCEYQDLFVTIQPINEDFEFKLFVYHRVNGAPKFVREITLKEIVNN